MVQIVIDFDTYHQYCIRFWGTTYNVNLIIFNRYRGWYCQYWWSWYYKPWANTNIEILSNLWKSWWYKLWHTLD